MEKGHTKIWKINDVNDQAIEEAAVFLKAGILVAFPTETVYGLGADARNEQAVSEIFKAKGRPEDNPLIVHVGDKSSVDPWVKEIPNHAEKLMRTFWPGPLTIILPVGKGLARNVTAGLETVGVRVPDHPVGRALLQEAKIPVAAPSANRSGRPSPTSAEHVRTDLDGRIAGILDGGTTGVGVESTVIDCSLPTPMILRPGGVTRAEIEQVIGAVEVAGSLEKNEPPRSPGMKYKHYAPETEVWLVRDPEKIIELADQLKNEGQKVGFLVSNELAAEHELDELFLLGSRDHLEEVSQNLYRRLREIDTRDVDIVLAESFSTDGIGEALMNRLERAATEIK